MRTNMEQCQYAIEKSGGTRETHINTTCFHIFKIYKPDPLCSSADEYFLDAIQVKKDMVVHVHSRQQEPNKSNIGKLPLDMSTDQIIQLASISQCQTNPENSKTYSSMVEVQVVREHHQFIRHEGELAQKAGMPRLTFFGFDPDP